MPKKVKSVSLDNEPNNDIVKSETFTDFFEKLLS